MKRTIILLTVLCLVVCVALSACGKKKNNGESTDTTSASKVTIPDSTKETEQTAIISPEVTVTVAGETMEQGGDIDVEYEVLKIGNDEIDEMLKREAETAILRCIPNISSVESEGGRAEYSSKMLTLFMGEKVVSAVFGGEYSVVYEEAAREDYGTAFYTINIDRYSGKLLSGADIISDFDKLKKAFEDGKFNLSVESDADLSAYRTEYGIYPYVSLDEESFHFYITDGVEEQTYVDCSMSLEEAKEFLNTSYLGTAK